MIVELSTSIRYGNYKQYKLYGEILIERILEHESKLRKLLNLPDKIVVKIRPMRSILGSARYMTGDKYDVCLIEIDCRQNLKSFDNTLVHELVHAEQYYENRLTYTDDKRGFKWLGNDVGKKYLSYFESPWEVEAFSRADELTPKVFKYRNK
jgi:hypothetical protein